jgi:hypothetical protein
MHQHRPSQVTETNSAVTSIAMPDPLALPAAATSASASSSFDPSPRSPSLAADPFLSHLHTRLTSAERSFLLSDYHAASALCVDILHELITLTSAFSSPSPLSPPFHSCSSLCVCVPTFTLLVQSSIAQQQQAFSLSQLTSLVTLYYGIPGAEDAAWQRLPSVPFTVCLMWLLHSGHWQEGVKRSVHWLEARRRKAGGTGGSELQPTERCRDDEYLRVLELLVFYALLPMGEWGEAAMLVRRSEILSKEQKETWLRCIRQMQEQAEAAATAGGHLEERKETDEAEHTRHSSKTAAESSTTQSTTSQVSISPALFPSDRQADASFASSSSPSSSLPAPPPAAVVAVASTPAVRSLSAELSSQLLTLHGRVYLLLHSHSPQLAGWYQRAVLSVSVHHRLLLLILALLVLKRLHSWWRPLYAVPLQRLQQTAAWQFIASECSSLAALLLSTGFGRLLS